MVNGVSLGSLVDSFLGDPDVEHVGGLKVSLGEEHSLLSGLGIVLKDPAVLETVSLHGSLGD